MHVFYFENIFTTNIITDFNISDMPYYISNVNSEIDIIESSEPNIVEKINIVFTNNYLNVNSNTGEALGPLGRS